MRLSARRISDTLVSLPKACAAANADGAEDHAIVRAAIGSARPRIAGLAPVEGQRSASSCMAYQPSVRPPHMGQE